MIRYIIWDCYSMITSCDCTWDMTWNIYKHQCRFLCAKYIHYSTTWNMGWYEKLRTINNLKLLINYSHLLLKHITNLQTKQNCENLIVNQKRYLLDRITSERKLLDGTHQVFFYLMSPYWRHTVVKFLNVFMYTYGAIFSGSMQSQIATSSVFFQKAVHLQHYKGF